MNGFLLNKITNIEKNPSHYNPFEILNKYIDYHVSHYAPIKARMQENIDKENKVKIIYI